MNILLTGGNGFIARNLKLRLSTIPHLTVKSFNRGDSSTLLRQLVQSSDVIFHLAATNRTDHASEFQSNNVDLTSEIAQYIESVFQATQKAPLIFFSSTTHVVTSSDSNYSQSKLSAEAILSDLSDKLDQHVVISRLPNVYGKFSKPFYNSLIATLCYCYANDLPQPPLRPGISFDAIYIDDLVDLLTDTFVHKTSPLSSFNQNLKPFIHPVDIDDLCELLAVFRSSLTSTSIPYSALGMSRRLHAMFVHTCHPQSFHLNFLFLLIEEEISVKYLRIPVLASFLFLAANLNALVVSISTILRSSALFLLAASAI